MLLPAMAATAAAAAALEAENTWKYAKKLSVL